MTPRALGFLSSVVFLLASLTSGYAQTSVTTDPVGFTAVTITPAVDANTPRCTVVSIPFHTAATFSGAMTSVDGSNSFSCSSAGWTASQFTTTPNLVRIKGGSQTGRYFLVTANTATQITVNAGAYNLTTILSGTDSFEVVPANTFASLFGTGSSSTPAVPFQIGNTANTADNLMLWNGVSWDAYFNNGTNWKCSGATLSQNNSIIYPDEAIFIIRRSTNTLSLTFQGTIPTTPLMTDIGGPGGVFAAHQYPVDTTLLLTGISSLPNWKTGNTANTADNLLLWNGISWDAYYHNGTNWKAAGSTLNQNGATISTNSGMFIRRVSAASGSASTLVQALPYSL